MSELSQDKKDNFLPPKTYDTNDACDTHDTSDTYDKDNNRPSLNFFSRFEPICVKKARETPSPDALRVLLSWMKKRGLTESQRLQVAKTFFAYHNLNPDPNDLLEILDVPEFTCDFALECGFCDPENCREKLPPADRLIMDTESVILFHSSGELDIKIGGRRKIIPLKKIFKKTKDGQRINTAIFDEIFLECYYLPPDPPFNEEDALRVYRAWIDQAEVVKDAIDPETALEETVIEIITTKRDFFKFELLKNGTVPPTHGFFVDDGIIYIDSELFRELLNEMGIKDRLEKVSKSCRRILAGKTKLIRLGKDNKDRRYFWRFSLKAIQAILRREGDDWEPEIKESFEIANVLKKIGLSKPDGDTEQRQEENPPENTNPDLEEIDVDLSKNVVEEEFKEFLEGDDDD